MPDLTTATEVTEALDRHAASLHPPRGDEGFLHVADLGGCDRETWARRRGMLVADFDADTHRKFMLGFAVEHYVIDALSDKARPILTGLRVAMRVTLDGVTGRCVNDDYTPAVDEAIGHPDGVGHDTVVEVKSTEFHLDRKTWTRIIPTLEYVEKNSRHYLLQCAAYALALRKEHGLLVLVCRTSGLVAVIPFDPRAYEADVIHRLLDAQKATVEPAMPWPTLGDWTFNTRGESWLCKYCRFRDCSFNRAKERVS